MTRALFFIIVRFRSFFRAVKRGNRSRMQNMFSMEPLIIEKIKAIIQQKSL